jgi:hypothetical protein
MPVCAFCRDICSHDRQANLRLRHPAWSEGTNPAKEVGPASIGASLHPGGLFCAAVSPLSCPPAAILVLQHLSQRGPGENADAGIGQRQVSLRLELAQGARRGPRDVGHKGDLVINDVDLDQSAFRRIAKAEQNGHKAFEMIPDHQVVGAPIARSRCSMVLRPNSRKAAGDHA